MKSFFFLLGLTLAPAVYASQEPLERMQADPALIEVHPQRSWQAAPLLPSGGYLPANVCFVPAQAYARADLDRNGRLSWGEITDYCRAIRDMELKVRY